MRKGNNMKNQIAIDITSKKAIFICNDKIVIEEPAMIAINKDSQEMIAIGQDAFDIQMKTYLGLQTFYPGLHGYISDMKLFEQMLNGFMVKLSMLENINLHNSDIVFSIPCGYNDAEKELLIKLAKEAGAKNVRLIYTPLTSLLGMEANIESECSMIINLEYGFTEISIVGFGRILNVQRIKICGEYFEQEIIKYLKDDLEMLGISKADLDRLIIEIGSVIPNLEVAPKDFKYKNRDIFTNVPKEISISYEFVYKALNPALIKFEEQMNLFIVNNQNESLKRIYLTGYFSNLRGMNKRLAKYSGLEVIVNENPQYNQVKGANIALKKIDEFNSFVEL